MNVEKDEILQYAGDLNSRVYEVETGLLRSYTIDEKGKEHIFMFAPAGWIIADSQPPDAPCDLYIDALEDSTVIVSEKRSDPNEMETGKLVRRISVLQKRVIMLMSARAIERYDAFVETYPDIVQRVPQHMIASYIGVTPEALSTVKSERAHR